MKFTPFWAIGLLVLSLSTLTCTAQDPDNKGTEFWLAFANNLSDPDSLQLFLTSEVTTSATVTISELAFSSTVSVTPGNVTTVNLPTNAVVSSSGAISNRSVHVVANDEISVYGINARDASTDAFLALPVDILDNEYLVLAHDSPHGGSFVMIVGTENNTTVTVTPSFATEDGKVANTPFNVTLNEGQVVVYYTFDGIGRDLSGTIVSADKPVSVFAGNECGEVPAGTDHCDHMVEQIPPSSTWGNRFVTIPHATRTRSIFYRFLAAEDGTTVELDIDSDDLTASETIPLDRGEYVTVDFLESAIINSDKPILVMQYSPGSIWDGVTSDPFMVVVPPFEQFGGNTTVINIPTNIITSHYINVIAPTNSIGNVFLDGSAISSTAFTAIGTSGFSGAQLSVASGTHNLSAPVAFGVTAYGYGQADSYGYPGGMLLGEVANVFNMEIISLDDSAPLFSEFCAVAKVTDDDDQPLAGIRVDFTVEGANPVSGFGTTDADGEALLCFTGINPGRDTLTATARLGNLQDSTTVDWFGLTYELFPRWNLIYLGVDLPGGEATVTDAPAPYYGSNTPLTFFGSGFVVYELQKTVEGNRVSYEYVLVGDNDPLVGGTTYWVYNPGSEKVTIEVLDGTVVQSSNLSLTNKWNMVGSQLSLTGVPIGRPVLSVLFWDGLNQRYRSVPRIGGQYFWDFASGVFIFVTEPVEFTKDRETD